MKDYKKTGKMVSFLDGNGDVVNVTGAKLKLLTLDAVLYVSMFLNSDIAVKVVRELVNRYNQNDSKIESNELKKDIIKNEVIIDKTTNNSLNKNSKTNEDNMKIRTQNNTETVINNTETGIQIFNNAEFGDIRTLIINGEPWFVAADVCRALEIGNSSQALIRLDEDEKITTLISNESAATGKSSMSFINEPGLYTLVLGSRKQEAKKFKRWVTHDVIPTIRKTGGYVQRDREEYFVNNMFPKLSDDIKWALVKELRDTNDVLYKENETLKKDQKLLSGQLLEWTDRKRLVAGIRKLVDTPRAKQEGIGYGEMFNRFYKNLNYKYGIDVKSRRDNAPGRKNETYISFIKPEEWTQVLAYFSAVCKAYSTSPSEMIGEIAMYG